mmetsp:Transcript_30006/g.75694  ORF Transcript_30006/g.75694 Transcript_30006/m.75694 type:complete len:549 (-) Transcript_30006:19-1665(-)
MESVLAKFNEADYTCTGVISNDVIYRVLESGGIQKQQVDDLITMADAGDTGSVNYERLLCFVWKSGATLAMWSYDDLVWSRTLSPKQVVSQMVVGPYSAFILLEDGTPWRIGPTSCDDETPLPEPQKLTKLLDACGGGIRQLGIDYMTLFALTSTEVWAESRPGEDTTCWVGAAKLLCCSPDNDNDDDEASWDGPRKAIRLCGKDVTSIHGNQNWGVAIPSNGPSLLYALSSGLLETLQLDELGNLSDDSSFVFLELDFGGPQVKKAVVSDTSEAAFLLDDGRVACIGASAAVELNGRTLTVPCLPELEDIQDITSDARVAMDSSGLLYKIDEKFIKVLLEEGGSALRLCGSAAVVEPAGAAAAAAAGEEIYAIGDRLALRWAAGLDSAGHVQQGRYFTAGYFRGGQAPSLGYEAACDRAQLKPGANLLAYLFGRDRDIRGGEHELPDGMDLERLEYSLKNDGYQIDSAPGLWDEEHFLYRFAESCEAGEAAVRLMIQQGASPEMMEDAVAYAVEIGDLETLGKLKAAGCSVSDDQLAECRRQADDEE